MNQPLVSILIPSYKPKHFEFALKSAIGQSYENIEIVVSDDCPDDSIEKIVNRYSSLQRIKYYKNPSPDGLGTNNTINCLHLASGEFVKFLFDDDVLMPFAVQYMVEAFINNKSMNPRLVVSERWFIDSESCFCGTNRFPVETLTDITEFASLRFMAIFMGNRLGEFSTAMWRREDSFDNDGQPLFNGINGHSIEWLIDVAMWVNLSSFGKVLYIALPLSCFRIHAGSNTSNTGGKNRHKIYTEWEVVVDQALEINVVTAEEALVSYNTLAAAYRSREGIETSLTGHAERLIKKIAEIKINMKSCVDF
jgi:glycosyltransferase involved in cell wall biosynthesis